MQRTLIICLLMLVTTVTLEPKALAQDAQEPSIGEVYYTAKAGDFVKAKGMVQVVLRSHPQSALAHYIAAEVYAMASDFSVAQQQLGVAQAIDPSSKFVAPEVLQALQTKIAKGMAPSASSTPH